MCFVQKLLGILWWCPTRAPVQELCARNNALIRFGTVPGKKKQRTWLMSRHVIRGWSIVQASCAQYLGCTLSGRLTKRLLFAPRKHYFKLFDAREKNIPAWRFCLLFHDNCHACSTVLSPMYITLPLSMYVRTTWTLWEKALSKVAVLKGRRVMSNWVNNLCHRLCVAALLHKRLQLCLGCCFLVKLGTYVVFF